MDTTVRSISSSVVEDAQICLSSTESVLSMLGHIPASALIRCTLLASTPRSLRSFIPSLSPSSGETDLSSNYSPVAIQILRLYEVRAGTCGAINRLDT